MFLKETCQLYRYNIQNRAVSLIEETDLWRNECYSQKRQNSSQKYLQSVYWHNVQKEKKDESFQEIGTFLKKKLFKKEVLRDHRITTAHQYLR